MNYSNIVEGQFISRPNRFIAQVLINNKEEVVHVKNTGRCKELLTPNATVFLQDCQSPKRKTRYDLISVFKGNRLVNMDSQIPNYVVEEYLKQGDIFPNITQIKREQFFGNSRFDFYIEYQNKKAYIEVKGVTLENNNIAMFPDAPTTRGTKHINELIEAKKQGYESYVIFVIQMEGVNHFIPHIAKDPAFSQALKKAHENGVNLLAFDCKIGKNFIKYNNPIDIIL